MFNHLSTSLFEETDDQVEKRKEAECYNRTRASWGLRHRDHWTSGSTRIGQFQISPEHQIQFQEEPGQQQRVWDCSLILSKFLYSYFPPNFFQHKRVIELGCGIGVPGLTASVLGSPYVLLTDMASALPSIRANIALNESVLAGSVQAEALLWGETQLGQTFDIILCSDLIYGDPESSELLLRTLSQLSHKETMIISVHEARFAGDKGQSFFDALPRYGFSSQRVDASNLDQEYQCENIHVDIIS